MTRREFPIIGREVELRRILRAASEVDTRLLIVHGVSGVGKTRLMEHLQRALTADPSGFDVHFHTIYRTEWRGALAEMAAWIPGLPPNATKVEAEAALIRWGQNPRSVLILDNVDLGNVDEVVDLAEKWQGNGVQGTLIVSCQPDIRSDFPDEWESLEIRGLVAEHEVLQLLGDLTGRFPVQELEAIGELLGGNPQRLLFLQWLQPTSIAELHQYASQLLRDGAADAIGELVDSTKLSTLFFLALGVHKDLNVSELLLASLWDHFGSRGAEPFVRSMDSLLKLGFLQPATVGQYRLHESVHVELPKLLISRIGKSRVPSLHHYFADFYRRSLIREPAPNHFDHFMYHAREAQDYRLAYVTLVDGGVAESLAHAGSTLQVHSELTRLESELEPHLDAAEFARFLLILGRVCNDLSEHSEALEAIDRCAERLAVADDRDRARLHREMLYVRAVALSNLGRSTECERNYFGIVASCASDDDRLACLSLGYLAHDLKYRDLALAEEIGAIAVDWAETLADPLVLAKNLCSLAESRALLGNAAIAKAGFEQAMHIASDIGDDRELGRIHTNLGFAEMLGGLSDGLAHIEVGSELSKRLGDRRRHAQARLYLGVCLCRTGLGGERRDRRKGRTLIAEAVSTFNALGDGRYLVPAIRWLREVDGIPGRIFPVEEGAQAGNGPYSKALSAARERREFEIYETFWENYLAGTLRGENQVG